MYNVQLVKGLNLNVEAGSPNDAIREFAASCGYHTVGEPDVIWCHETNTGAWKDIQDDAKYIVSLLTKGNCFSSNWR